MLRTDRILKEDRLCKALTGMSEQEFNLLLPLFSHTLMLYRYERKDRKRAVGGGRKGDLPTPEKKLLFILMYLKVYPTYDVMGILTDRLRSRCCESVKQLLPLLEKTLGRSCVLPARKISSVEEFTHMFAGVADIFIDGSERRIQRPKNQKKQQKLYSGKKKAHTRKTVIVSDKNKNILLMTPTKSGRRHDKRICDKFHLPNIIPKSVTIWADTGFQGITDVHPKVMMPAKASKNKSLTKAQKENNKTISSIRVVVEHAIGGYKRFKAASDIYRNKSVNLDDRFNIVAAGLWNFHLQQG